METQGNSPVSESKWRWLLIVDGILILILCVVLLTWFTPQVVRRFLHRPHIQRGPIVGEKVKEAASKGVAIQDIRLLPPRRMAQSGIWIVEIEQRDLVQERRLITVSMSDVPGGGRYYDPSIFSGLHGRTTVNLLIYSEELPKGFLLFDQQVLIEHIMVPRLAEDPQDYILYDVVSRDTDGDGRLTREDDKGLWISDLDGRQLTQITPDSLALSGFSFGEGKRRIYIAAWKIPEDRGIPREHWEQAIYVFDIGRRSLDLVPIDPVNFQKARSLLQR